MRFIWLVSKTYAAEVHYCIPADGADIDIVYIGMSTHAQKYLVVVSRD